MKTIGRNILFKLLWTTIFIGVWTWADYRTKGDKSLYALIKKAKAAGKKVDIKEENGKKIIVLENSEYEII